MSRLVCLCEVVQGLHQLGRNSDKLHVVDVADCALDDLRRNPHIERAVQPRRIFQQRIHGRQDIAVTAILRHTLFRHRLIHGIESGQNVFGGQLQFNGRHGLRFPIGKQLRNQVGIHLGELFLFVVGFGDVLDAGHVIRFDDVSRMHQRRPLAVIGQFLGLPLIGTFDGGVTNGIPSPPLPLIAKTRLFLRSRQRVYTSWV